MFRFNVIPSHMFSTARKLDIQRYLKRQSMDEYVLKARTHSYRARSAFKLIEIDDRFRILKPGSIVVDIGCAPGSWSQVVVERCKLDEPNATGYLLGVDMQIVTPIPGADTISFSDVCSTNTQDVIRHRLNGREVDVILSDMAPNPTGDRATDHLRLVDLCRTVFHLFHPIHVDPLHPGMNKPLIALSSRGVYVCKIWDGNARKDFTRELGTRFKKIRTIKPKSCRESSAELYLVCSNK